MLKKLIPLLLLAACVHLLAACANYELASTDTDMRLHDAARAGNLAEVERLLAANADVNKPDKDGFTPLYVAVESGEEEVATLLRKVMGR